MTYPKTVLIVSTNNIDNIPLSGSYITNLRKLYTEMLILVSVDKTQVKNFDFKYFSLDGEINPISGSFEVTKELVSKLSDVEQQKLYEELHRWGHRVYA